MASNSKDRNSNWDTSCCREAKEQWVQKNRRDVGNRGTPANTPEAEGMPATVGIAATVQQQWR